MPTTSEPSIDLALLSPRERSVVELAMEGKTDEQIAQALDLSVSTVGSYWVRVRGKIGHLGRVEIVAGALRRQWEERCAILEAERATLLAQAGPAREAQAWAESALEAAGGANWPLLALDRMPAAALVAQSPGVVTYANRHALRLLRMDSAELVGRPLWELSVGPDDAAWEDAFRRFFAAPTADGLRVGGEEAYYLRRGDGSNFRATLAAEPFDAPEGAMAILTLGSYLEEFETFVRAVRRPLASKGP